MKKLALFCLLTSTLVCMGQVSLVPATHQVYEWLYHQRILGNVSEFQYEAIPISRKKIVRHLNQIKDKESQLSKINKSQLNAYLREFTQENLAQQSERTVFQGKKETLKETLADKLDLALSQEEFHLYSKVDSTLSLAIDPWWGQGFITSSINNQERQGLYNFFGFRSYGTIYGKLGYHIDYQNIANLNEDNVLKVHPTWMDLWTVKRNKKSGFYAQAFTSLDFNKIRVDVGRGALNYGVGKNPLILHRLAPDFDWFRLTWKSKYVDFDYIHGALQSFGTEDSNFTLGDQEFTRRTRVPRWFVLRRLTFRPTKWIDLAYSQTTIYSDRGIDISHLNPVLPAEVSELNSQDLDNPSLYLDLILRPVKGLELFATASADDINKRSDIFKSTGNRSSEDGVFGFNIGANYAFKTGTDISIQYTQLDPYYYTHRFRYNVYENFDKSLGAQIDPNSDQIMFTLRQWLPRRSWVEVRLESIRQGFNVIEDNELVEDVGGDLFEPQSPRDKVRFLSGNLNKWNELSISGHFEPSRAISVNFSYQKTMAESGTEIQDTDYLQVGLSLGY